MQKVESSSLFSRLMKSPANAGLFFGSKSVQWLSCAWASGLGLRSGDVDAEGYLLSRVVLVHDEGCTGRS